PSSVAIGSEKPTTPCKCCGSITGGWWTGRRRRGTGRSAPDFTTFHNRRPRKKPHGNGEPVGPWNPITPTKVVEVRDDHFNGQCFRPSSPFFECSKINCRKDCVTEQMFPRTLIRLSQACHLMTKRRLKLLARP